MAQVFLKIYGQVQDVGFRWNSQALARTLSISGWVKNAKDGAVEILAQGGKHELDDFIAWAKSGPSFAEVNEIEIAWQEPDEVYKNFEIKY